MIPKLISLLLFVQLLIVSKTIAHPGSGIVVDNKGQVYFMDTGKGVWKIDEQGKLSYMQSSRFHWLALDEEGYFANAEKTFGVFFERVTKQGIKPAIIICSDFPFTISKDGNLYYADTRKTYTRIVKRTPAGKETVLLTDRVCEFVAGMATGPDGSLYITEGRNPNANTIRKINSLSGTMSTVATFTGKSATNLPLETTPSYCRGLSVDSTGNMYVAATGSRSIIKVTPQGKITTILQASSPWTVTGVAIFQGEMYIMEWHDVPEDKLEMREAYIPRVCKLAKNGRLTILATISRN